MAEETNQNQAGDVGSNPAATASENPPAEAKAAKKEKAPALEDKPFEEFMQQHYLPALQEAITKEGVPDVKLSFAKQKYSIIGFNLNNRSFMMKTNGSFSKISSVQYFFPNSQIKRLTCLACRTRTVLYSLF